MVARLSRLAVGDVSSHETSVPTVGTVRAAAARGETSSPATRAVLPAGPGPVFLTLRTGLGPALERQIVAAERKVD